MMRPENWPVEIDAELWAKSQNKGEDGKPESLAQHTWQVLCRLSDFARLRPNLNEQLNHPTLWHCLFWGAFLHDFGKAMPGFQGGLRGDKKLKKNWGGHRHEVFSLAFIGWITSGFEVDDLLWCAAIIALHHKDPEELWQAGYSSDSDADILEQLAGIPQYHIHLLFDWLTRCGWEWAKTLGLDDLGVGPLKFTSQPILPFAPWAEQQIVTYLHKLEIWNDKLGGEQRTQLLVALMALRGTLINSDHSASAHFPSMPTLVIRSDDVLQKRTAPLQQINLFSHQQDAGHTIGSALLTAPTGSGKTEAALLWAANQMMDFDHPRLFYTLPYQASMNAMQYRLQEIFGSENVGLQHGRSLLTLYRQLMERSYDSQSAALAARQMRDLNRLNYPPVRVFSPYQILKGMYRLKGYEAQLTDYQNALFIFDEIHAYEVNRLALILKTIAYLSTNFNARFLIMSATFPSIIKTWLKDALRSSVEIQAESDLYTKFQRHRILMEDGDMFEGDFFVRIEGLARSGKSILVVCNLVDRAQIAYQLLKHLKNEGIQVELLHGRFNLRDRFTKEGLIRACTGSTSTSRHPIVLIATQVVEVSLDIDLDVIFSDPAPLEALVQRFGRINRRRKMASLAEVHVFTKPDDGQKIYDALLVERSLAVLKRENGNPIDEGKIGDWLDDIYAGVIADQWEDQFEKTSKNFENDVIKTLRPFRANGALENLFYRAFDNIEILPEVLYDEYLTLKENNPIQANELLVPITWGRFHALSNHGLIFPTDYTSPPVVKALYSTDTGLSFEREDSNPSDD